MKRRDDPNQILIDWGSPRAAAVAPAAKLPDPVKLAAQTPPTLIERLPWDFTTTFPQPTDEALDAGVVDESDLEPENLRGLHENYTRQCLATLQQLDRVMDARRHGVDPATGKAPTTHASRERLHKYFSEEPAKLEHAFQILVETYENAFGFTAAHAFNRFIRARHAGILVEIDASSIDKYAAGAIPSSPEATGPRPARRRSHPGSSRLPVPRPLPDAVKACHFGLNEDGTPLNPTANEVRAITKQHVRRSSR